MSRRAGIHRAQPPVARQAGIHDDDLLAATRVAREMTRSTDAGIHDDDDFVHGDRVARETGTPQLSSLEPGVKRRGSGGVALGNREKKEGKKENKSQEDDPPQRRSLNARRRTSQFSGTPPLEGIECGKEQETG
ncbi:hypothetical protein R3P38DRAFT_2811503 [Favolaschia claudopus]|uniref:Uncharacterized protein n=1 Tax=Favolaschia claudopus TaxID=2862362 RepID=A0AAV9ZA07_9AGAR